MKRTTPALALACLLTAIYVTTLSAQTLPAGHVICPVLENSRLVKGCSFEYRSAINLGDAHETKISDCLPGTFHDPRNGGECWSCPAGFIRNVSPVFSEDACWKAVSEDLQPAKRESNPLNSCPSGTFHDPRNGGECWSCPSGYSRTWDPVTSNTACHKYALGPTSPATLVTKFGCQSGTFFDPIHGGTCWSCPAEYRRTANHIETAGACAKTLPTQYSAATYIKGGCQGAPVPTGYDAAFYDPIDDGTCWSCPVMFTRSLTPVNEGHACSAGGDVNGVFVWQSPQYPEPGLFHFVSRDVLNRVFADPAAVDRYLSQRAGGDATKKKELWNRMLTYPSASPELKALLFAAMATIAESGASGIDGLQSVSKFESYVRARRTYVAQDAMNMYDAWLGIDSYVMTQAARNALGVSGVSSAVMGGSPPSFTTYAWAAAGPDIYGEMASDAVYDLGSMAANSRLSVTPGAEAYSFNTDLLGPLYFALEKGIDAYRDWAITLNSLGSVLGHSAAGMGAALALVVVQQSIDFANAVTTLVSKEEAKKEMDTQLAEANQSVSFKSMYATDEGKSALLLFWSLATSPYQAGGKRGVGALTPSEHCAQYPGACAWTKWRVAQAAKTASAESIAAFTPLATQFVTEPPMAGAIVLGAPSTGTATSPTGVTVDASGSLSTSQPASTSVTSGTLTSSTGGGGLLSTTKTTSPTPTVDLSNPTVTIQPSGMWTPVPGGLISLSVGPQGPWGTNDSGGIFRYANGSWTQLPGAAVTVSAGPAGDVWVVNAAGQIFRWLSATNSWEQIPGGLVGISAGPNDVWGVNAGNQIYRYASGQWHLMPGSATAVAVNPTGEVWALGTNSVPGGRNILRWNPATSQWTDVQGGLVQISAGTDGLWGVNNTGTIWHWSNGAWSTVDGSASVVSIGPRGEVWALGSESVPGGHPIKKRN